MYSYIKGIITIIDTSYVVLENNGIGYMIYVANPYSYKENEEDYFPTNKQYQYDLNMLKDFGLAPYSRFPSKSESGIGGSAKLNLDYYLLDDLVVGGSLNYNTFGDYNEMYEMLYIKSVLGGH